MSYLLERTKQELPEVGVTVLVKSLVVWSQADWNWVTVLCL